MKQFIAFVAATTLTFAACGANYDQTLNDLVPRLADPTVGNRYAAQMELQALAAQSSKPGNSAEREALGRSLAAKAADAAVPQPARVWIVRQLEYMGGGEAVDALTAVLNGSDAELRECARRALEKNPAAAASASLRAALAKATDATWQIGLINSLGQRDDTEAVSLLAPHLTRPETGRTAALALGHIASPASVEALWGAFGQNRTVGDALVLAGNRITAQGNTGAAAAIFEKLYAQPGTPAALRAAALSGLAKVDPAKAEPLLAQALQQEDPRLRRAALSATLATFGSEASGKLAGWFPKLPPPAKLMVLDALNASALSLVTAAVQDPEEPIRLAAVEALGRIGNPEARAALETAAMTGDANTRVAALATLAERGQTGALPTLLKCTAEPEASVRRAAFSALRLIGGDAEIDPLAKLAIGSKSGEALEVLAALAERAKDKPAAAHKLLVQAGGNEPALVSLAEVLSVLGGDEALAAVSQLASSGNAKARQSAVQALGNWADLGAAKPLLALAANGQTPAELHALAEQGIVTLVKSTDSEPAEARAAVAVSALAAARGDNERKLVLSALAAVPLARSAAAIQPLLADPGVKNEAALAGITVAEGLAKTDRAAARQLAAAVKAANASPAVNQRAEKLLRR